MTTKAEAIREARLAVTEAEAKVARLEQAKADAAGKSEQVQAMLAVLRKRAGRRQVAVMRPGGAKLLPGMHLNGAYMPHELAESCGTNTKKWIEAVATGAIGLSLPEGTNMKARGFAAKARYVSPASLRAVKAAERRKNAAAAAYANAQKAYQASIEAAWSAGEQVKVEEVADLMGRYYSARALQGNAPQSWTIDSAKRDLREAQAHLTAMQGKGECNCWKCHDARRALENAARDKRLAALPRVRYTCPRCAHEVVAIEQETPEGRKAVACPRQECRGIALTSAIKVRRAPKGTPIGEVKEAA